MSNKLVNLDNDMLDVLSSVVIKASNNPTEDYGFKAIKKRMELATNETVILADHSSSMIEYVGGKPKLTSLKEALRNLFKQQPTNRLIMFGYNAYLTDISNIDRKVEGFTNLAAGLQMAIQFKPKRTIVITDGCCDNEFLALEQAGKLTGVIDIIFCGDLNDTIAIEFLKKLARISGGREITVDMTKEKAIDKGFEQLMLCAPDNEAIHL
jgi:hypothetical protein